MSNQKRSSKAPSPLVAGFLLCLLATIGSAAPDVSEAQLERLRAQIHALQRDLNETRGRRDHLREELQAHERRVDTLLRSLRALDARLARDNRALEAMQDRTADERRRLREQTAALELQLRAAYAMGQQPYLKMLLNQEQPAATARVVSYYRYFNAARLERIESIQTSLARLTALEEEVRTRREEVTSLRDTHAREKRALEETRARRSELLASLNREVRDRAQEIARLKADETRLERLLREIKSYLPAAPAAPLPGKQERFAALKGRLPLPFAGRIAARYGEPRGLGDLRWRGIFLAGREGQTIHAVSRGRVAYAEWLRGFGLLLILDHGDGYMTLYGHNQTLYRQVGDWVEAGQPIATVGSTGDAPGTGVYFEIRHNGSPHDPLHWCATGRANTRARR